jgi:hypothetical protein
MAGFGTHKAKWIHVITYKRFDTKIVYKVGFNDGECAHSIGGVLTDEMATNGIFRDGPLYEHIKNEVRRLEDGLNIVRW